MEKTRVRFGHVAGMCALCGLMAGHAEQHCRPMEPCRHGYHLDNSDAPLPFPSSRQAGTIVTSTATGTGSVANIDFSQYIFDPEL